MIKTLRNLLLSFNLLKIILNKKYIYIIKTIPIEDTNTIKEIDLQKPSKAINNEIQINNVFNSCQLPVLLIDLDYKIRAFNKTAQEILLDVFNKQIKLGDSLFNTELIFTDNQELEIYRRVFKGESIFKEFNYQKNNQTFFNEVRYNPVYDDNSKIIAILIIIIDLTQSKELEKLAQNTIKQNIELTHKHDMTYLLNINSRVASFGVIASGITHEINQPLNALKLGASGLKLLNKQNRGLISEKLEPILDDIYISVNRIDDIIKHLRKYWIEPESGDLSMIEINSTIFKASDFIKQRFNAHEIELKISLLNEKIFVYANEILLEIIINNLLLYSLRSHDKNKTKDKWINLEVIKHKKTVTIEINDNAGMFSDEEIIDFFEPKYLKDPKNTGTGFDLAIIRNLACRFNADISIKNNSDSGACFILTFVIDATEEII